MTQSALQRRLVRLAASMNKKALILGAPGRVTAQELAQIILDSEGVCNYCGDEIDDMAGSFDHVIAFDRGGPNLPINIVRCCMRDQRSKFTKSREEYAVWQKLLVTCPVDGKVFRPRWADWIRGFGKTCSRACAGTLGGRA